MESDRELLLLAAKACGYTLVWGENYIVDGENIDCTDMPYVRSNQQDESDWYWNPLEDDGDALRLAVKTGVMRGRGFDNAWNAMYAVGQLPKDPCEAYRRAIVRAAAEIGKTLG